MPRHDHIRGNAAACIVAAEVAVIYVLSTLPTPIYVIYRQQFRFSEIVLTLIYAAYVIGTVVTPRRQTQLPNTMCGYEKIYLPVHLRIPFDSMRAKNNDRKSARGEEGK